MVSIASFAAPHFLPPQSLPAGAATATRSLSIRHPLAAVAICLFAIASASADDHSKVNGSVEVAAGQQAGDVDTVNGSIRIEEGATVGDVETVNGSVRIADRASAKHVSSVNGGVSLGAGAKADSMETVNGKMQLGEGAQVAGDVTAVNGAMTLSQGASVSGELANVNGVMTLEGAHVGKDLRTTNGDITLRAGTRVDGGILVKKNTGFFNWHRRNPRIVIGPDTVVAGTLRFEQEVDLFVSDRAKVGAIEGAKPVMLTVDEAGKSIPKDEKVEK